MSSAMLFMFVYCTFSVLLHLINSQELIQSAHLKPSSISTLSGISVYTGSGITVVDDKWSVNVVSQQGADLHIAMGPSWGFHPLYPSSIQLYIQGSTSAETYNNDGEILFVFSVDNEYFAEMISIDTKKMSFKECPRSNTDLIRRNISQMINTLKPDRYYRFCKNAINTQQNIDYWDNVASTYKKPAYWPMDITITYNPILNVISYSWTDSNVTSNKVTSQYTSPLDIAQKAINIYLSGDSIHEDFYIFSIDVGYSHNITANPTTDPTKYPTAYPTTPPTTNPTAYPTAYSTANPTAYPTTYSTTNPTVLPTMLPTAYPTYLPTALATNPPIWIVNTTNIFIQTSKYKKYTTFARESPSDNTLYNTLINVNEKEYYESTTEIPSNYDSEEFAKIEDNAKSSWLFHDFQAMLVMVFFISWLPLFGVAYYKKKCTKKKIKKLSIHKVDYVDDNNDNDSNCNNINVNDIEIIESTFGGHGSCYKSESAMIAREITEDVTPDIMPGVEEDVDDVIGDDLTINVTKNSSISELGASNTMNNSSSTSVSSSPSTSSSSNLPMLKWHNSTRSETEWNDGEKSETEWRLSPKELKEGNSKSLNNLHIKHSLIQQQFCQQYKSASNHSFLKQKTKKKKPRTYKQSIQSLDI